MVRVVISVVTLDLGCCCCCLRGRLVTRIVIPVFRFTRAFTLLVDGVQPTLQVWPRPTSKVGLRRRTLHVLMYLYSYWADYMMSAMYLCVSSSRWVVTLCWVVYENCVTFVPFKHQASHTFQRKLMYFSTQINISSFRGCNGGDSFPTERVLVVVQFVSSQQQ